MINLEKNEKSNQNSEYIFQPNKHTLKGLKNINPNLASEIQIVLSENKYVFNETLEFLAQKRENILLFQNFTLLGEKYFTRLNEMDNSREYFYLQILMRIEEESFGEYKFEFIFKDLSEQKKVQQLKTEIGNKTMTLAKISHEFKNPIIIIGELSQEISEELNNGRHDNKVVQENLNLMNNLAAYILVLVKDFEVISKKEASSSIELVFSWFDIRKELSNLNGIVITLISKKYGEESAPIEFIMKIDENVPYQIYGDKIRLLQILINLISNSIKFTRAGSITLLVRYDEDKVLFSVEDMGCGLSEDQVKNLFKEYAVKSDEESNSHGSGLGLSIVKELCTKMGSTINFCHNTPHGSIFSFALEQTSLRTPSSNNPNKIFLDDLKRIKTIYSDKLKRACTRIKSTNLNISQLNIFDQNEPKFSTGDFGYLKRFELNESNSMKTKTMLTNISFNKTLSIDSVQVMSNPPLVDINNNLVHPYPKTSNISILKITSESHQPYERSNYYKQNGFSIKSEISINHFDFFIPAFETTSSSFFKSRMQLKKISNQSCVHSGNIMNETTLNIIIVDDDKLIRKSIIRVLEKFFEKRSVNVNIIELPDGVECLFAMYNSKINNKKIDLILSDENMNYMSGFMLVDVATKLFGNKTPVAIITSYEGGIMKNDSSNIFPGLAHSNRQGSTRENSVTSALVGIFPKPLTEQVFEKILTNLNINYYLE